MPAEDHYAYIREVLRTCDCRTAVASPRFRQQAPRSASRRAELLAGADETRLTWPLPEELDDTRLGTVVFLPECHTAARRATSQPDWPASSSGLNQGMTKHCCGELTQQLSHPLLQLLPVLRTVTANRSAQRKALHGQNPPPPARNASWTTAADGAIIQPAPSEVRGTPRSLSAAGRLPNLQSYAEPLSVQSARTGCVPCAHAAFYGVWSSADCPRNLRRCQIAAAMTPTSTPPNQQLAAHYRLPVVTARPNKPRHKAKAELGVQIRRALILARFCAATPSRWPSSTAVSRLCWWKT